MLLIILETYLYDEHFFKDSPRIKKFIGKCGISFSELFLIWFASSSEFIDIQSAVTLSLCLFFSHYYLLLLTIFTYLFIAPISLSLHPFLLIKQLFLLQFHSIPHKSLCILDFTRTYPLCKNPFFTFSASYIRILGSENVRCAQILFQVVINLLCFPPFLFYFILKITIMMMKLKCETANRG